MPYGFMVDKYFIKVEKGMIKNDVIGGPVYENNVSQEVIGLITDYNKTTGFIKIELTKLIDYKCLVKGGIPLCNIIFNNKA